MADRQTWEQLARELGFEFKTGLRAYLDSDAVRRMEADGSDPQMAEGLAKARAMLDNPLVMGLLDRLFFGVVTGSHRGYAIAICHGSSPSGGNRNTPSVNVSLLFKRREKLGLLLAPETFFTRVGRTLFRTQDLPTGNAELDRLVVVKANEETPVRVLLGDRRVQEALIALFRDGAEWKVSDEGIRWRRAGGELTAGEVRLLLDRMTDVAQALGR